MKILSDKIYDELVKKAAKSVDVEDPRIEELNTIIKRERKSHEEEIAQLGKNHSEKVEGLEKKAKNLEEDNKIIVTRKDLELDNKVAIATTTITKERDDLKMKLNNAEKEVEILTKAFANLGFDVKDMKEILNKLVDGIVSKNTISIVK